MELISGLSFQTLFDVSPDAMLLSDESGLIVLANPAALTLFRYTKEDMCKLKVEALMPVRHREYHKHYRKAYIHKPEARSMSNGRALIALRSDGQELTLDISLTPLKTNEQLCTLAIFYPTDRRRVAEEAYRASEERLKLATKAADLAIFDFDSNRNVLHWDEDMRLLWGAESTDSISNKRFSTVIHPEDRKARQSALDNAIDPKGNGEYNSEYRVINPSDGSEQWVSAVGRMHFEDGHATRLVGVARNITRQKVFEDKLRKQRNENEILFKEQVAAQTISAIAHEINQPLTAISAYSEVALRAMKVGGIYPDNLKRALEGCVHQAQRAGNSLHELLSFLNKSNLVREVFDLNRTVKEALTIAKDDGYGGFYPELQLEKKMPNVIGNKTQVQKVIVNLIRNAVEAMQGIGIDDSKVMITVQTHKSINLAHLLVKDNGPGLDVETQKHIFEPFFTTKPTGIGMGLSISRALIEANGGELWFEPNATKGATFHFTLPFAT
ncbi:PAS domain-containing sensor histidine kinase [Methylotenera sp.]|uniref:PAS domain-containing sensor histidine kinase n=1 Tax=Methylotenera sp. TaxID=2051956 RepID=UPI0024890DBD|nr:PAS domain-containing sensor histidine kinase [Methylotenera sp.]MDI1361799.1 PAS domain-containing sensor histidine kinase [Methylotenera sp.]